MTQPTPQFDQRPLGTRHTGCRQGRILSIGGEAQGLLDRIAWARVVTIFKSALYLRSGDYWACLGSPGIGRGPLNVTCDTAAPIDWREVVSPDDTPVPRKSGFSLGTLTLSTDSAEVWQPCGPLLSEREELARGLEALIEGLPPSLPAEGLAWFLCHRSDMYSVVAKAAQSPVEVLAGWLREGGQGDSFPTAASGAVRSLLGLGPGLTPSGDDFLAGMVVGLRAIGQSAEARSLGREIAAMAPSQTNEISEAHLFAALRAGLSEDLHNTIHAMAQGEAAAVKDCLLRFAGTAHCSSWDALAGAATAFRSSLAKPAQ
jgi:hypothetical protein